MAKFCINCGKKLKDGEVCDCNKNVMTDNELAHKLLTILKGMIYTPIDTMKDFIKESNFSFAMILIGVLSILSSLFLISSLKNGLIDLNYYGSYSMFNVQIPYMKIFFTTLIIVFACSFIYSGILYFVNSQIFKTKCDFKEVYTMYSISSVILSIFLAVAAILAFVNVALGIMVAVFGSLLSNFYCYHGLKFLGNKDENRYGYIYLTTYAIFTVFVYILAKIFS